MKQNKDLKYNDWAAIDARGAVKDTNSFRVFISIFYDLSEIHYNHKNDKIRFIINRLEAYIHNELKKEEEYLVSNGFPNSERHILQHQVLVKKINEFKHEMVYNNPFLIHNMLDFLKKWLITHILHQDIAFSKNKNS
jgi:hemerythrin-like metal-binding protein